MERTVDPLGNVTELTWDDDNSLTRTVDPRGGETVQTWDENNNLLSYRDPGGDEGSRKKNFPLSRRDLRQIWSIRRSKTAGLCLR